ncbi:MAG: cytochrome c oxidase accessory protein CcoG [Myxococcales bacterium]|nr:cytochrome c oxidase accessory protein CcoG [Myxococcales bacterium]MCB9523623.1 cytochrome c oxidase accessory protein CcoG [Myxococcales bacterium]
MALVDNDALSTIGEKGKRIWLYPLRVVGRFVRARTLVAWGLIIALFIAPWIDVAGHPAMFFDFPHRRFYFWGLTLFATDANYLLFLAGTLVFGVFLFTAVFGRVWCGWACPQTVFLESVIRPIEELIEGKPSQRKKLDAAPWTPGKVLKKGLKLSAFLAVSGMVSTTLVAYFLGRDGVIEAQFDPASHPIGTAFFVAMTGIMLFDFTWFREQTCVVVCPYGRFQSVLMDGDSLAIGYDYARGEPRGKAAKGGESTEKLGDCVDCKKCVQVCPTGIDIRKGNQLECVNCTACIDACDSIMDKLGRERGLIRYSSENSLKGEKTRIIRPRVVFYSVALTAVLIGFFTAVTLRQPVEIALNRLVGAPFVQLPDGRYQNQVELRIANKSGADKTFSVKLVAPADAELFSPFPEFKVTHNQVTKFPILIRQKHPGQRTSGFALQVSDGEKFQERIDGVFLAPDRE